MSTRHAHPPGNATAVPLTTHRPRLSHSLSLFRFTAQGSGKFCTRANAASGAPSSGSGPLSADVAPADVDIGDLAEKARLQLSAEESADFQSSVARIVGWFGQLQAADVAGVEPAVHAFVEGEPGLESLRSDTPVAFEGREAMLQEVPSREGPYLKVPRILGAEPDA